MKNEEWMMYEGTTNYKLLGAYVAEIIIGYSIIDFFSKTSLSLNIFRTRGRFFWEKNDWRGTLIKKKKCVQREISHPSSPLQKNNGSSLSNRI